MTTLIIVVLWGFCSVLAYGMTLAFFQKAFPTLAVVDRTKDRLLSLFVALFGPIGLFTMYFNSNFGEYGFMWRIK